MRDTLPKRPYKYETGIINHDVSKNSGTHWTAYKKYNRSVIYYDSFGNLRPPVEVIKYFNGCDIQYNFDRQQQFNTPICGHLCIQFLLNK